MRDRPEERERVVEERERVVQVTKLGQTTMPGGYHVLPGDADDIAGHLIDVAWYIISQITLRNLWKLIKLPMRMVCMAKSYGMWLLALYCGMIWPVFNRRWLYWDRSRRDEYTWVDCVRLWLAIPVMIGLMGLFVWMVELATVVYGSADEDWEAVGEALMSFIVGR